MDTYIIRTPITAQKYEQSTEVIRSNYVSPHTIPSMKRARIRYVEFW